MKKFDIAFDEPFSQIDVLVDDEVFPRLMDGEASPDGEAEDEVAKDEETEDGETEDEKAGLREQGWRDA